MDPTTASPKRRPKPCRSCHKAKKRCVLYSNNTCIACHEKGRECSLAESNGVVTPNAKRKTGEIESGLNIESTQNKKHASAVVLSRDTVSVRNDFEKQLKSRKSSRPPEKDQQATSIGPCSTCKIALNPSKSQFDSKMVLCGIESCGAWLHLSCILFSTDPKRTMIFPANGLKNAEFICPNCLDHDAEADIKTAIERLKERKRPEGDAVTEPSIQVNSPAKGNAIPPTSVQAAQMTDLRELSAVSFEPAREEKYQGYDQEGVAGLVQDLHDAIFDYNREVCEVIDRFGGNNHDCTKNPLAAWENSCACKGVTGAQPWYHSEGPVGKQCINHSAITAALRSILDTSCDVPLVIDSSLRDLSFSLVHTTFVGWFVFDVLNDELRLYQLSNMKILGPVMSAVKDSGNTRWPGQGRSLVREVQLRAWHKDHFQTEMLLNCERLMRRMEAYLQPLTKNFGEIGFYSQTRMNVINCALKLSSYLLAAGGRCQPVQPMINASFDRQLQDAFDKEGNSQVPDKDSNKKILWPLSPGIRCEVDGLHGPCVFNIKGRVVVS